MNTTENQMSTRRLIVTACNSFESVTGKKAKNATVADIEQWLGILRGLGRSAGTCRTYLWFVKQKAGLEMDLPKRGQVESRTLSNDEVKAMLSVANPNQYALLAALALCGADALSLTWKDAADLTAEISTDAKLLLIGEAGRRGLDTRALLPSGGLFHFVNGPDLDELIFPHSQHEVNRRLKSVARKAGIGEKNVNITAMKNTYRRLLAEVRDVERFAAVLGVKVAALSAAPLLTPLSLSTATSPQIKDRDLKVEIKARDGRLHGMLRRSASMKTA